MLNDEHVIFLRRTAREQGELNYQSYALKFGVSDKTIGKAVRGIFYKHLNAIEAPVQKPSGKAKLKAEARRLYAEGNLSYNDVIKKLGVSSSTMSLWCRDIKDRLAKPFLLREEYKEKKKTARALYQEGKTCQTIADILGVGRQTVCAYCNDLIQIRKQKEGYRPETTHKSRQTKDQRSPHLLTDSKVIALRQKVRQEGVMNAVHLAGELNVKPQSIRYAVQGKSFKHLNDVAPPVVLEKAPKQNKPAIPRQRVKRVKVSNEALRKAIAEADRYERWAKAGFPSDWGEPVSL